MSDMDEVMNSRVVFGLAAQGHIPTIRRMLGEGSDWVEIGKAIGWDPQTAFKHWVEYLNHTAGNSGA